MAWHLFCRAPPSTSNDFRFVYSDECCSISERRRTPFTGAGERKADHSRRNENHDVGIAFNPKECCSSLCYLVHISTFRLAIIYIYRTKYWMGEVKFVEGGRQPLKNLKWYGLPLHFKAVFHKFYLVHYWILCPIYCIWKRVLAR